MLPELGSITNPLLIAPSAAGVIEATPERPVQTGVKGKMYNHAPGVYYPFLPMDVERRQVKEDGKASGNPGALHHK